MATDHLSDFLNRLRTSSLAGKTPIIAHATKVSEAVARVLESAGYLKSVKKQDTILTVSLSPVLPFNTIKLFSKPGRRLYTTAQMIPRPKTPRGVIILSTPKGMLSHAQARKQRVGGELICEVN